jgi:hypothetical protein
MCDSWIYVYAVIRFLRNSESQADTKDHYEPWV